MKKLCLSCFLFCIGAFALYAQNLPSVRIVNNTGYAIYHICVSPSSSDDWGDDFLGEDILEDGETLTIRLPQPLSTDNVYDFGMQDENVNYYFKYEVTITNNIRIVFTSDDFYEGDE